MTPAVRSILRWIGITFAALIVIVVLVLSLLDWNMFKHPIERIASAKSGRAVTIGGDLKVHIWSWAPTVTLNGLTLGNPPWESDRPMAKIERLQIQVKLLPLLKGDVIFPRVEIIKPEVYLHQDKAGKANWTFENKAPTNAPTSKPTKLPVVRDFLIESGTLTFADDIRKLKLDGTIQAHEKASSDDAKAFRIEGKGTINEKPFTLNVAGGPLINLDPKHPYPFDLKITAGDIQVESDGTVNKPFDLGDLQLEVTASGRDLAELYYLTQITLPNTPAYKLHARIDRKGNDIKVTDIAGSLGTSDLSGNLEVDASKKRPRLTGALLSKRLALSDLAASVGGSTAGTVQTKAGNDKAKASAKAKKAPADPNARLFPDSPLQVERVRAMDADVKFQAQAIDAGSVPMKAVSLHIKIDEGVLSLDPFSFDLPQGRLTGKARIDARKDIPQVRIDLRMKDIQLDQLKGSAPGATPALGGVMQARAVIDGTGDSLHKVMSTANGTFTLILPKGEIRSAFAELTGINVAKGVGLLLKGENDREVIRCGVAQFGIQKGDAKVDTMIFDTQNVHITGLGDIHLGPEELDLSIKGEPKKIRLTRLRTPVEVKGHLLDPKIGVNVPATVKQGAIAAALGVVATPAAAILAFVDPGLAKDENCSALVQNAENKSPAPVPGDKTTTEKATK
jgi:uncharacterized protein involved in outer membrane biogenesis